MIPVYIVMFVFYIHDSKLFLFMSSVELSHVYSRIIVGCLWTRRHIYTFLEINEKKINKSEEDS